MQLGEVNGSSILASDFPHPAINSHRLLPQALLHRAALSKPFGILKYAMTLDGKIATSSGHAAWISSTVSRDLVFKTRARSGGERSWPAHDETVNMADSNSIAGQTIAQRLPNAMAAILQTRHLMLRQLACPW